MDGGGGDDDRPGAQDQKAEGGVGGSAGEPPDVVQPGAGMVEDAVAQERQRVGGGQDTGGPGEPAWQRGDGEQRPGQEPGQDRHDGRQPDVFLLGGDPVGHDLGDAVHEHGEGEHPADEPADPAGGGVEVAAAQPAGHDQGCDLEQADRDGYGQVAEHDQAARNGGGQQFPAGAAGPVDDDADPGEGAGERDEQSDGADDDEGAVVGASRPGRRDQLGQGRSDHQGEQQRGGKRGEDLARGVGAEGDPAPGQGGPGGQPSGSARSTGAGESGCR